MTKFLLIDQSLKDFKGHHYEYAGRVLEAAASRGFETILAAHRAYSSSSDKQLHQVIPVFHHTYWENTTSGLRFWWPRVRRSRSIYRRSLMRPLGVRLLRAQEVSPRQIREIVRLARITVPFRTPASFGLGLSLWMAARARGKKILLSFGLQRWLARIAAIILAPFLLVSYLGALLLSIPLKPLFRLANRERRFAADLEQALRGAGLRAGDHVFIPTLGSTEIVGLVALLKREAAFRSLKWSLLFRRDIFTGYRASYASQQEGRRDWRLIFDYLRKNSVGVKVGLFADTAALAEQYQLVSTAPFTVLPVPVDQSLVGSNGNRRTLRVCYLGDARDEKGYHFLPSIIRQLRSNYLTCGRAVLRAQSNYNVEGGEPGAKIAHALLSAEDANYVELVHGPLDTESYKQLLLASDIIIAPYQPVAYAARSSATFMEALAAGIPCVTTAGSWMARIIDPHRQTFLRRLFYHGGQVHLLQQTSYTAAQREDLVKKPNSATHVLFRLPLNGLETAEFLGVQLQTFNRLGVPVGRAQEMSAVKDCVNELLLPFEIGDVHTIRWKFISDTGLRYNPNAYSLSFYRSELPVALGFGVMTCAFEAKMVGDAIAHVIDHYSHFKKSVRQLSKRLLGLYDAQQLVTRLTAEDELQLPWEALALRQQKIGMITLR